MKEADLALTNAVLSLVVGIFAPFMAWAFSVVSTLGGDSLERAHIGGVWMMVAGILVFGLCWTSFRGLLRLRGGSDRGWFYAAAVAADLGWLLLVEAALIAWGR
jgi:hypothetical protein